MIRFAFGGIRGFWFVFWWCEGVLGWILVVGKAIGFVLSE